MSSSLYSQFNNYKFITYTTEAGLPNNSVVKIISDRKGFLWIATKSGLSRFDGLEFHNYTEFSPKNNGLRSSWITDLIIDKKGILWISTEWGLCYYDEPNDHFNYINRINDLVILYKAPMFLEGDILWIATESGLKKVNTLTKKITPTSLLHISDPQSICADEKGQIWIGTRGNGFYFYNISQNVVKKIFFDVLPKNAHLMNFYKDNDGLWVATSEGLLQIHNTQSASLYQKAGVGLSFPIVNELMFVTSFAKLTGDTILVCGTYNKRLAFFNKNSKIFSEIINGSASLLHGIPNAVLNDADGSGDILWMGTDKGLSALNPEVQDYTSYLLKGGIENWEKAMVKKIKPFTSSKEKVLMLVNNPGGMLLYNTSTISIEKFWKSGNANRKYKTLITDKQNNIWLLHEHGIDKFSVLNGITQIYFSETHLFYSAFIDENNSLWAGTDDGLMHSYLNENKPEYFSCRFTGTEVENSSFPAAFLANEICSDNKGKIWIASTKYGLFSFDKSSHSFTAYRQPSTTSYETKNRCESLSFDKDGQLWIGTLSGLTKYDIVNKKFTNYNYQNGLFSSYVYALTIDATNNIVGRGNSGVFNFDIKENKFINYNVPTQMSTDILEQQVSILGDKAFIGFIGGFSVYNIHKPTPTTTLPVFITGCNVKGTPYPLFNNNATVPLNLNYQQNVLHINYTCVNYNFPADVTYRYQLNGANKDWKDAGIQRSVLYTDLAPGKYLFKVMAIGPDGKTSTHPASLSFIIHPPFWKTTFFEIMVLLLISGFIFLGFYLRITKIKKEAIRKTETNKLMAEAEMKALRSQMNPHFVFNSLNSIQKYIWENKQDDASEYLTKFARLIRLILENSGSKMVTLHNELTALKLYVELEHRRSNHKFDYGITVDENILTENVLLPPLLLQPYIENAIWHGLNTKDGHGNLNISIHKKEETLVCIIDDDGIGRKASLEKKQASHKSMGLNISSQRIQLMEQETNIKANVEVIDKTDENNLPAGTTVIVTLPLILADA